MLTTSKTKVFSLLGAAMLPAMDAAARQPAPDYDFNWVTVDHAGNRAPSVNEAPLWQDQSWPHVGSVDHNYRISRNEVTVLQWFEFVQAYSPYHEGAPGDSRFTSRWIVPRDTAPGEPPQYEVLPGAENYPATFTWRFAARYVNWLHNDKRNDESAFRNGVYDTTTFVTNPDGTFADKITSHAPDSRFWIPTIDEWTKAAFYDPNRYGPGQDGYWRYPNGTNQELVSGPPGVGQTSAGLGIGVTYDVGSYPDVLTPWGLLDASGSEAEWTETLWDGTGGEYRERFYRSSSIWDSRYPSQDRLDAYFYYREPSESITMGMRVASLVPTPTAGFMALVLLSGAICRRR